MKNSEKIELQLRKKFGLIAQVEGECSTSVLPKNAAGFSVKDLERFLAKDGKAVDIKLLNVFVDRKSAQLGKLAERCHSAEQIRDQDQNFKADLEFDILSKINQSLSTQPQGQLMAQTVLDELEEFPFQQYRGPIELFQKHFKNLDSTSSLEDFATNIAQAIFQLVKHRDIASSCKVQTSNVESSPLH
ncbi:hypothetical protein EV673_0368 [Limnobacter thiooxidans]|uniref:Uncharacterized protein n=1 Tax=Limnobacter thiooxidans TaxID=131080 RepID=A0AA86M8S0_9BURK|nr:hypothetical protein EV673_0368 [Limnobacter thiooxidans]BET26519.1 hypothetical protein RGQ30_20200 [Limnobacter thiooxidans]